MRKEKIYSIAYRKRDHQEDFFWLHDDYVFKEAQIDNDGRYWFADPFLYERNGRTYIFYEAFDLIERKGKIGYSIIAEDGSFSKPRIIINEKCRRRRIFIQIRMCVTRVGYRKFCPSFIDIINGGSPITIDSSPRNCKCRK